MEPVTLGMESVTLLNDPVITSSWENDKGTIPGDGILSAVEAHKIATDYYESKKEKELDELMEKIREAAGQGLVDLKWDGTLTTMTIRTLYKLGYNVNDCTSKEFPCYKISW